MTGFKSIVVLLTLISVFSLHAKPVEDLKNEDGEDALVEELEYGGDYDLDDDGQIARIIDDEGNQYGEDLLLNEEQFDEDDEGVDSQKDRNLEENDEEEPVEVAGKEDDGAAEEKLTEKLEELIDKEDKNVEENSDDKAKETGDNTSKNIEAIDKLISAIEKEVAAGEGEPVIIEDVGKDAGIQTNSVNEKFIKRIEDEIVEEQNFVKDVAEAAEKRLLKHIVQEMEQEEERILENIQ